MVLVQGKLHILTLVENLGYIINGLLSIRFYRFGSVKEIGLVCVQDQARVEPNDLNVRIDGNR